MSGRLRILKCPFDVWKKVARVHSEKAAGYIFACYDCALRDVGQCRGYPCSPPPEQSLNNVFAIIEFLEQEGLTRREQGLALFAMGVRQVDGEPYNGDWISTFVWRKKHGRYIPPSFLEQIENDTDCLIDAMARS